MGDAVMPRPWLLFLNVLVIATCGLVYELLAGTLASYVLGDSVTQFSLIIGVYLSALGVGAWLSRFVERRLAQCFVEVETGVALLGGLSAPLLFFSFSRLGWFHVVLYAIVFLIGVLVGLELPLLMRILRHAARIQGPGEPGADVRLHRRAGRFAVVSAVARAATGIGAHVAGLRNSQRRGRALEHVALAADDRTRHFWAAISLDRGDRDSRRWIFASRSAHVTGRRRTVRRPDRFRANDALPANRHDCAAGRAFSCS